MRGPGKSAAAQLLLEVHAKGLQKPPNPRMVHPEGSGLLGVRDMGFSVLGPQGWWIPLGTGWSGGGGGGGAPYQGSTSKGFCSISGAACLKWTTVGGCSVVGTSGWPRRARSTPAPNLLPDTLASPRPQNRDYSNLHHRHRNRHQQTRRGHSRDATVAFFRLSRYFSRSSCGGSSFDPSTTTTTTTTTTASKITTTAATATAIAAAATTIRLRQRELFAAGQITKATTLSYKYSVAIKL